MLSPKEMEKHTQSSGAASASRLPLLRANRKGTVVLFGEVLPDIFPYFSAYARSRGYAAMAIFLLARLPVHLPT